MHTLVILGFVLSPKFAISELVIFAILARVWLRNLHTWYSWRQYKTHNVFFCYKYN